MPFFQNLANAFRGVVNTVNNFVNRPATKPPASFPTHPRPSFNRPVSGAAAGRYVPSASGRVAPGTGGRAGSGQPFRGGAARPGVASRGGITPAGDSTSPAIRGMLRRPPISAEMHIAASGSRLAQSVLTALQHEGKPSYLSNEKYLKRFARTGWDEEETAQARNVLRLWNEGQGKVTAEGGRAYGKSSYLPPFVVQDTSSPTPFDKAVNTIEELQALAEDFPEYDYLEEIRRTRPEILAVIERRVREQEELFMEKYGLKPQDVAWFASDREVALEEMFAMVLSAEGGSVAQSEELIVLLANRAHTFTLGAKNYADREGVDYTEFLTADALLEALNSDPESPEYEVARRIVNNIFAHDDSFFGARDFSGLRTSEELAAAWSNLTRDPRTVSSGLGGAIIELASGIANPDLWQNEDTRLISGQPVYTQANQAIIPDVNGLNARLSVFGLGNVVVESVPGGYAVFLNFCQELVRRNLGSTDDEIRAVLTNNGCI